MSLNKSIACYFINLTLLAILARISHKSSTALRNVGTGAALVGFACPRFAQMQATLRVSTQLHPGLP